MSGSRWLLWLTIVVLTAGVYVFVARSRRNAPPGSTNSPAAGSPISSPSPSAPPLDGLTPPPSGLTPPRAPGSAPFPPGAVIREQAVVDLNSASLADLQTLPGITPDYARKIVAGRPYRSMDDVMRAGIPRAIIEQITPPAMIRMVEGRSHLPSATPIKR